MRMHNRERTTVTHLRTEGARLSVNVGMNMRVRAPTLPRPSDSHLTRHGHSHHKMDTDTTHRDATKAANNFIQQGFNTTLTHAYHAFDQTQTHTDTHPLAGNQGDQKGCQPLPHRHATSTLTSHATRRFWVEANSRQLVADRTLIEHLSTHNVDTDGH
jgi:hypothetical protein